MAKRTWTFELEGQRHTLELEHGVISGKRVISIDGQVAYQSRNLIDSGSLHNFRIDGHWVQVFIQPNFLSFVYDLLIDNVALDTRQRGPRKVMVPGLQWGLALSATIILMGVIVAVYTVCGYNKSLVVQDWPQSRARVVVVAAHECNAEDSPTVYCPALTFEYAVNDRVYRGQETDHRKPPYATASGAQAAYSPGEELAVHYNPDKPGEAYLDKERIEPGREVSIFFTVMCVFTPFAALLSGIVFLTTRHR